MYKSVRKLLAIVLLLALPLQGLSAVLIAFHCPTDEQHASAPTSTQLQHGSMVHEHDTTAPATAQQDDSPSSSEAGHPCCNHVYTGAPSVAVLTAPDTPFVAVDQISIVPPPFFPERLLRPPRA